MASQLERKFLSVIEAEQVTGLSRWTWRKYAYAGRCASAKIGTRLLIPVEEVTRIMDESMRPRLQPITP